MYYLFREVDCGSDGTVIVVWNSLTLSQRIILVLIYSFVYSAWWRFLWYSNYIFIIYLVTHWMHVIQQCLCNQIHVLFHYFYLSDQACVWFLWYSHWKLYSLLSHIINTHLTPVFVCLFIRLTVYYMSVFIYLTRWMGMLVGRSLLTGTACYLCRVHTSCTTPYRSSNPCHTAQNSDENHSLVDINFYIDSLKCARCININGLKLWMNECLTTP